jgi:hypothetical protein
VEGRAGRGKNGDTYRRYVSPFFERGPEPKRVWLAGTNPRPDGGNPPSSSSLEVEAIPEALFKDTPGIGPV